MAGKLKWDINGKGEAPKQPGEAGGGNYNGPDLPKGSWPARIKRMEVTKIQTKSDNYGKPRIRILLEVQTAGIKGKEQYHGAPVWDGLNIIESGKGFVNAFLHALTDGSERAKRAIESVFWDEDKGADFKKVRNKKSDEIETHIVKIGRVAINSPNGEKMVQIVTRPGHDNKGNYRPEVAEYIPYAGDDAVGDDSDAEDVTDDDDMLEGDVDDEDVDDDEDMDDDEDVDGDDDEGADDDAEPVAAGPAKRKGGRPF